MSADSPISTLTVFQPDQGFRYGSEAFAMVGLLLDHGELGSVVDLGTGSGILALLAAHHGGAPVVGFDVQERWAPFWSQTLTRSVVSGSVRFVVSDISEITGIKANTVVCNPPFFAQGTGPVSPNPFKARARTESTATLIDFVHCSMSIATEQVVMAVPRHRVGEARAAFLRYGWGVVEYQLNSKRSLLHAASEVSSATVVVGSDEQLRWENRVRLS